MKKKNKTYLGLGVLALGTIYLAKRFSLKVTDNANGTITVKVVNGFKVHKRDYSLRNGVSDIVFEKYKLHVDPQKGGKVSVQLVEMASQEVIEERILFIRQLEIQPLETVRIEKNAFD